MIFLVYASSAVELFSKDDLVRLLAKSRDNNSRAGVTGMLLYKDGNFMQVLEGEAAAVESLHARIGSDPRHRNIMTLLRGPLAERHFPDWSMGFRDLASEDLRGESGYSEILNTPLTGQEFAGNPSLAQKLLLSFKRVM